jgi:PAS domain S-box-containing protein
MTNQLHLVPEPDDLTGEDGYRQLFENSPIGIINVSLDAKPLMVNERAATSFGYASPEEFLENVSSMRDLWVDPSERDLAVKIMRETGVLRDFEVVMKRRDGSRMTLAVSANPWRGPDGTFIGVQISGVDITDRVRAEHRLEEAQSHASIAFWSLRLDTNEFIHSNDLYGILGVEDRTDRLHIDELIELVHPEDREVIAMKLITMKRDPGERGETEFRVVTRAGTTKWLIARGRVDDDIMQLSGSFQDITEQKLVEEQLTELMAMKTEFVSVVAHDLRMPLTVASGYAEFLHDRWDEVDEEQRRGLVEKIQRSLERLGVLVADVSEVTRIDSGAASFDVRPFDLADLVRSAAEDVSSVEPYPSCDLSIPDGLPFALGDRESVWRVVSNLLSNAVKYSPEGEPITIAIGRTRGFLRVSVTDRGPGIALSDQPKLFQKFSRLPSNASGPRPSGTGLGLFICKSLVEGCGGWIWVDSAPSKGSTFNFTLPIAA